MLPADPHLLTIAEVAEHLGVSIKWVRRSIASGALPAFRLGRSIRLRSADVDALLRPLRPGEPDIDTFITEATS